MHLFYSGGGGSRNYTPESVLEEAPVMLTFFLNANQRKRVIKGKERTLTIPDNRFQEIIDTKRELGTL